ncbi:MAG TPA: glycogen-binding domain-containing protein [Planctomycetota bacterium]
MLDRAKAKITTRRVPFQVKAPGAQDVRVTGDFIRWGVEGIPLGHDGTGLWRTMLPLEPGEYQYRLLVDGVWSDHAEATEHVPNPFGSRNGLLKVV